MERQILTREQSARLNEIRSHWLKVRQATGPADRERAQSGISQAYRAARRTPPTRLVWVNSPQAGALVANELAKSLRPDCGAPIWLSTPDPIWWPDNRNEIALKVCDVIPDADGFSTALDEWDPATPNHESTSAEGHLAGDGCDNPVWHAAVLQIVTSRGMWWFKRESSFLNRQRIPRFVHGREGARQLAYRAALDALSSKDFAARPGIDVVAEEASWWWPFEKIAVVCERPVFERRDSRFRLHNETGPALVYPDGYSICALHGRKVPPAEILIRWGDAGKAQP